MRKLRLYPRGYLGAPLTGKIERVEPTETTIAAVQNTFKVFQSSGSDKVLANDHVESLYKKLIGTNISADEFEFTEEVLVAALGAFGTGDFHSWVSQQSSSPYFGKRHSDFIDDTLNFIMTGERTVDLTTWDALIKDDDDGMIQKGLSDKAKSFFGVSHSSPSGSIFVNINICDVIQSWISKPGGVSDMVQTLHILFGDI